MEKIHTVNIDDIVLKLPIRSVSPRLDICLFNPFTYNSDTIEALAGKLVQKLKSIHEDISAVVVPEAKAITLGYELSKQLDLPLVVLRKTQKAYMVNESAIMYKSITSGNSSLILDGADKDFLAGKSVITIDDVHSTGATLQAMNKLLSKFNITVAKNLSIFTEGNTEHENLISLGNLPVFEKDAQILKWD